MGWIFSCRDMGEMVWKGGLCFYRRRIRNTPKRIRTAAAGVKGRCPRPLDDGGIPVKYSRETLPRQYSIRLLRLSQLA